MKLILAKVKDLFNSYKGDLKLRFMDFIIKLLTDALNFLSKKK